MERVQEKKTELRALINIHEGVSIEIYFNFNTLRLTPVINFCYNCLAIIQLSSSHIPTKLYNIIL